MPDKELHARVIRAAKLLNGFCQDASCGLCPLYNFKTIGCRISKIPSWWDLREVEEDGGQDEANGGAN